MNMHPSLEGITVMLLKKRHHNSLSSWCEVKLEMLLIC